MILGIQPGDKSAIAYTMMKFDRLDVPTKSFGRENAESDFTNVIIKGKISNLTGLSYNVNFGWALYHGNNRLRLIPDENTYTLMHLGHKEVELKFNFGSNLADGKYRLVPMSRIFPDGEWEVCEGGDVNYVEAIVSPTSLSLVPHGVAGNPNYNVNDVTYDGYMHPTKTIKVIADITNNGTSINDNVFLFVDGVKTTMEMLDINPGESGKVTFFYCPETAGTKKIQISLNDDGTEPLYTKWIQITEMPAANLKMEHKMDGLQKKSGVKTLVGNTATVTTTVTNKGAIAYSEDVVAKLIHVTSVDADGTSWGQPMQTASKQLNLDAKASTTFTLNFNDLIDGERYFIRYYYLSYGEEIDAGGTVTFTVERKSGDVNGDNTRDVEDMNLIINIMVKKALKEQWPWADVNGDGVVDVDDLNPVVSVMVGAKEALLNTPSTFVRAAEVLNMSSGTPATRAQLPSPSVT